MWKSNIVWCIYRVCILYSQNHITALAFLVIGKIARLEGDIVGIRLEMRTGLFVVDYAKVHTYSRNEMHDFASCAHALMLYLI